MVRYCVMPPANMLTIRRLGYEGRGGAVPIFQRLFVFCSRFLDQMAFLIDAVADPAT